MKFLKSQISFVIFIFSILTYVVHSNSNIFTNSTEAYNDLKQNSTIDELKNLDEGVKPLNNENLNDTIQNKNISEIEHLQIDSKNYGITNDSNSENQVNNDDNEISLESSSEEEYNTTEAWEKLYNQEKDPEEEDFNELVNNAEKVDVNQDGKNIHEDPDQVKDWEKKLSDFEPAEMLTFAIEEDQKEMIFDPIYEVPSLIKFAYIVNDDSVGLDFELLDPNQNVILKESSKSHIFHQFNATIAGEYIFTLDNKGNSDLTKVTFAIHQGISSDSHLSIELMDKFYSKLKSVNKLAKKSSFTARLLSKKHDSHFENTLRHNRNIVLLSLIETAIMILIFFFQLFYIKKLANKISI